MVFITVFTEKLNDRFVVNSVEKVAVGGVDGSGRTKASDSGGDAGRFNYVQAKTWRVKTAYRPYVRLL